MCVELLDQGGVGIVPHEGDVAHGDDGAVGGLGLDPLPCGEGVPPVPLSRGWSQWASARWLLAAVMILVICVFISGWFDNGTLDFQLYAMG